MALATPGSLLACTLLSLAWQEARATLAALDVFLNDLGVQASASGVCSRSGVACSTSGGADMYEVDLSRQRGIGGTLANIGGLIGLKRLVLPHHCSITGPIPTSISNCVNLEFLEASYIAGLQGPLPAGLFSLPLLREVRIQSNSGLAGSALPADLGTFNGTKLELSANGFTGTVPTSFGGIRSALRVDLSQNSLSGGLPAFGKRCRLRWLSFSSNGLTGGAPGTLSRCVDLVYLSINSNSLTDPLPPELGQLPLLQELRLSSNAITGPVPAQIAAMPRLRILRLNNNKLEGPLPEFTFGGIRQLHLFNNEITGTFPTSICQHTGLTKLSVHTNQLTGPFPACIGNLTNLQLLWFASNNFTGSLPAGLGNIPGLQSLRAQDNGFTGPLPPGIAQLSQVWELYLSDNGFTGALPDLSNMTSLRDFRASNAGFSGPLPALAPSVETVMLGQNRLTGPIPASWKALSALSLMDLSSNSISGWVDWGTFPGFGVCSGSSTQTAAPANWAALQEISVSGNPLGVTAEAFLQTLSYCFQLQRVSCSSCGLTGELLGKSLTYFTWSGTECLWTEAFSTLQSLDLTGNSLTKVVADSQWQLDSLLLGNNQLQEIHPKYFGGSFRGKTLKRLVLTGNPSLTGCIMPASRTMTCADWAKRDPECARIVFSTAGGTPGICLTVDERRWAPVPGLPSVECTGAVPEPLAPGDSAEATNVELSSSFNESAMCRCASGYYGLGRSCQPVPKDAYSSTEEGSTLTYTRCPANMITSGMGAAALSQCMCIPGFFRATPEACAPCPKSTYRDAPGATSESDCTACPDNMLMPGVVGGTNLTDCICKDGFRWNGAFCSQCEPGRYAQWGSTVGASLASQGRCADCPAGKSQTTTGSTQCKDCQRGFQMRTAGATSCERCSIKSYANVTGMAECTACPGSFIAEFRGATSELDCQCESGLYRSGNRCLPCPGGMTCAWGSSDNFAAPGVHPVVLPGFWSSTEEPLSVFKCSNVHRCPGGAPKSCGAEMHGVACGRCTGGHAFVGETCRACTDIAKSGFIYPILPLIVMPLLVCFLYRISGDPYELWNSRRAGISAMIFICLNHYQLASLATEMDITMPARARNNFEFWAWTVDIATIFRTECSGFRFMGNLIAKSVAPAVYLGLGFATWAVSQLVARASGREALAMDKDRAFNAVVSMMLTFFAAIVKLALDLFVCQESPNDKSTLMVDSSVVCFEDKWMSMLAISIVAALLWCVGTSALFVYGIFSSVSRMHEPCIQRRWKFLFQKYRTDVYWWALVYMLKGLLVNFGFVVFNAAVAQIMWLICMFSLYIGAVLTFNPWRHRAVNVVDVGAHMSLLLLYAMLFWFAGAGRASLKDAAALDADLAITNIAITLVSVPVVLGSALFMVFRTTNDKVREEEASQIKEAFRSFARLDAADEEELLMLLSEWEFYYMDEATKVIEFSFLGQRGSRKGGYSVHALSDEVKRERSSESRTVMWRSTLATAVGEEADRGTTRWKSEWAGEASEQLAEQHTI